MSELAALHAMIGSAATRPWSPWIGVWDPDALPAVERLKTLAGTAPDARPMFEALIAEATARGMKPWIISVNRNCQDRADAERSWHGYGRAIDLQLLGKTGSAVDPEPYLEMGEWWETMGGIWGGRWTDKYPNGTACAPGVPGDICHFQWTGAEGKVSPELYEGKTCEEARRDYAAAVSSSPVSTTSGKSGGGAAFLFLALAVALSVGLTKGVR